MNGTMLDFSEKVVFLTGGGGEIGTKTADLFLRQGAQVVSTDVSDSAIDFIFEKNIQGFPQSDVKLTLTFLDNAVDLYGWFYEPVIGVSGYSLDALAVPEPTTLLLFSAGALMLRHRKQSHKPGPPQRMAG